MEKKKDNCNNNVIFLYHNNLPLFFINVSFLVRIISLVFIKLYISKANLMFSFKKNVRIKNLTSLCI